jgi:hypothetical protein
VRCPPRDSQQDWLFRPSIDAPGETPSNDVLTEVHNLATGLREALSHSAITHHLHREGLGELAASLVPPLRKGYDEDQVSRWYQLALAGERRRSHPFFFQDGGRRLALQFVLKPDKLDRAQLKQLISATLQHLGTAMDKVGG